MKAPVIILVAILFLGRFAYGAGATAAITQAEAETFVRSFYHALEGPDFDKVMAHFDETVQYYNFGPKDRAYVANDLQQYSASYPSRTFTVSEIKSKPIPNGDGVSVKFDVQFFIRSPERDISRTGRSHVELDLARRDGGLKITRFDGRAAGEPTASPSP